MTLGGGGDSWKQQMLLQVNLDMTDSVGPGKLVRHMQNPSYAYDGLSPSYAIVYLIALGTSVDL